MSNIGPEPSTDAVGGDSGVGRSSREATPEEVLQFVLKKVESANPGLAAAGRVALQQLMGREGPSPRGIGKWRHDRIVKRVVKRLVPRERDPETVTEVADRLVRFASRLLKPRALTPEQRARLRTLAATAKPTEITRTLLGWRYDLPDRTVRRLQSANILAFRWH
jgi:hypothetical protein